MKSFLALLVVLFTTPAWATFTLVQAKVNGSCASANCNVTVTSTGAGHSIIVGVVMNSNVTISGVIGGGTYTLCGANCQKGNGTTGFTDMAYTLSSTSGTTTIEIDLSAGSSGVAYAWELSSTSTITFDVGNSILQTTNCTSCTGASLTLTGSNDFIAAIASCGGTCSAVTPYTADNAFTAGDGQAHSLNTSSGTAPTWTQSPTNPIALASLALKDAGGGGGSTAVRGKAVTF
jgi:hypothetical protein